MKTAIAAAAPAPQPRRRHVDRDCLEVAEIKALRERAYRQRCLDHLAWRMTQPKDTRPKIEQVFLAAVFEE